MQIWLLSSTLLLFYLEAPSRARQVKRSNDKEYKQQVNHIWKEFNQNSILLIPFFKLAQWLRLSSSYESKQWYSSPFIFLMWEFQSKESRKGDLQPSMSYSLGQSQKWIWQGMVGADVYEQNQGSRRQSKADSLSLGFLFNILQTRAFKAGEQWSKAQGKLTYSLMIFLMVLRWYQLQKGVLPVTSLKMVTPAAQISTFQLQPPPLNISGARQKRVPVIVSMSMVIPLRLCFLQMPKSISFNFLVRGSQRIFQGLTSL